MSVTETKLAEMWTDILHTDKFDWNIPFLDYGDSMAAVLCHASLMEQFAIDIPLSTFFDAKSSLREIAVAVDLIREASDVQRRKPSSS